MVDGFGRTIDYLRISVTDKCNLRCKYCMPQGGVELLPHEELLTLEEVFRVVDIMSSLGIFRVRFTGGEPLVRKNLVKLIADVHDKTTVEEIALTTNGVLLEEQLPALQQAGVTAVNISLDTVNPETFAQITGANVCDKVIRAVQSAVDAGIRTKINCVPCREWNEGELVQVAELARNMPVDVRFIELMPLGCGREFHGIPSEEVLAKLERAFGQSRMPQKAQDKMDLGSVGNGRAGGPAKYRVFDGFLGQIGFISPMSHQFCSECNRVRLTAEGRLKLCLHYDTGIELKPLLRGGCSDEEIRAAILDAVENHKPKAHAFGQEADCKVEHSDSRRMVQIGG